MYIVFEGTVGSGKTSQAALLVEWMERKFPDRTIVLTREPGGTEIADAVRKLVQATPFSEEMDPVTEAYLYAASRAQSLRRIVWPCLCANGFVISDRSFITSLVFQGYAEGVGTGVVKRINSEAISGDRILLPDVILFLDLPVEVALGRTFDFAGDKWEARGEGFFRRVSEGYKCVAASFGNRWVNISASGSREEVFERVLEGLEPFLRHLSC